MEEKLIFQLSILLQSNSDKHYRDIHNLLRKLDYKNSFTADLHANFITPLLKLMHQFHRKEISAVNFAESIQQFIAKYKPVSKPSLFLSEAREIYFNGIDTLSAHSNH